MDAGQLDGLIALKIVSEKRSFKEAAEILKVTGPAVSKMIAQLEKKLGVTLLTRTTRTVHLTEVGRGFLDHVNPAIDQILSAQEGVRSLADKPSGLLRINIPSAVYPSFLAKVTRDFASKYPDIRVELYASDEASNIFENGFDAGIRISDILAKDMIAIKLRGPVHFATAASPSYLKRRGRPLHPRDLLSHDCVTLRFGSAGKIYDKWEFEEEGKEFEVRVTGSLILNDSLLIKHAAIEGAGIIYQTVDLLREDLKAKKLELVLEDFHVQSAGYYLYYPSKSQVSPKLRAFINELKNSTVLD